jgi:RNase P subunit RPR2
MSFLKNYTAVAQRTLTKTLFCEKCGKHVRYDVTRKARGYTERLFSPMNKDAATHVMSRAVLKCNKRLNTAVSLVSCPTCGWYQRHMVQQEKNKRCIGLCVLGLVSTFALIFWQRFKNPIVLPSKVPSFITNYFFLAPLLLGLLLGTIWYLLYDPNRGQAQVRLQKKTN